VLSSVPKHKKAAKYLKIVVGKLALHMYYSTAGSVVNVNRTAIDIK
jgi:hypothetical protein